MPGKTSALKKTDPAVGQFREGVRVWERPCARGGRDD